MSQPSENILDVRLINVADIDTEETNQPREKVERIKELALSLKTLGQLSPINVVAVGQRFRLIDGHRRLEAIKLNKEPKIQASVFADEGQAKEHLYSLVANANREQLTPAEEAQALHRCLFELPADVVAGGYGLSVKQVESAKRGAKLIEVYETQSTDQLYALDEFKDDPDVINQIVGSKDNKKIAYVIETARAEKVRREAFEKSKADTIAAGARWLDKEPAHGSVARQTNPELDRSNTYSSDAVLIMQGKSCGCDGYVAWQSYSGVQCGCDKPENHGFVDVATTKRDAAEEKATEERIALKKRYEQLSTDRIGFIRDRCKKQADLIGKTGLWNLCAQLLVRTNNYDLEELTAEIMGKKVSIEDLVHNKPENFVYAGVAVIERYLIQQAPYRNISKWGYAKESLVYFDWLYDANYDMSDDDKAVKALLEAALADGDE